MSTLRTFCRRCGQRAGQQRRQYAVVSQPQTRIEKIVQKYAVDIDSKTKVKAGDYLMIRPVHV